MILTYLVIISFITDSYVYTDRARAFYSSICTCMYVSVAARLLCRHTQTPVLSLSEPDTMTFYVVLCCAKQLERHDHKFINILLQHTMRLRVAPLAPTSSETSARMMCVPPRDVLLSVGNFCVNLLCYILYGLYGVQNV